MKKIKSKEPKEENKINYKWSYFPKMIFDLDYSTYFYILYDF